MTTVSVSRHALLWRAWLYILDYLPIATGAAVKCPQNCLFSRLNQPWSHSLFSQGKCSCPSRFWCPPLNFLQLVNVCLVLRSPKWNAILQMWSKKHWEEGIIPSLVFWLWLYSQPRILLVLIIAKAHSWLILSSLLARAPRSFSTQLLPLQAFPTRYHSEIFPSHLFLLNFMRSVLAHSTSLSRSLWMQLCVSAYWLDFPVWYYLQTWWQCAPLPLPGH